MPRICGIVSSPVVSDPYCHASQIRCGLVASIAARVSAVFRERGIASGDSFFTFFSSFDNSVARPSRVSRLAASRRITRFLYSRRNARGSGGRRCDRHDKRGRGEKRFPEVRGARARGRVLARHHWRRKCRPLGPLPPRGHSSSENTVSTG